MVTETRNINNFEEVMVSSSGELECNSVNELFYYTEESKKIIEERQDKLFSLSLDNKLYYIERIVKDEDDDNEYCPSLTYDGFEMFFTSIASAYKFMDSFMDIGMQAECTVVPIECYRDLVMTIYSAFLADDLIIKRIEYKDETESWHCSDLLYDPERKYEYKSEENYIKE